MYLQQNKSFSSVVKWYEFINMRHNLCTSVHAVIFKPQEQQDSPPAWTQEAYGPPCSKYSLCCPNWVPPPARVPPLARVPPRPGYPPARVPPQLDLPGYPPGQGTPPAGPARVPPRPGYPPGWTCQGTPPAAPWHSGKCCKALWDMGTPPVDRQIDGWMDGWMDRRVSKHYLPVVLRTRAVNIFRVSWSSVSGDSHVQLILNSFHIIFFSAPFYCNKVCL